MNTMASRFVKSHSGVRVLFFFILAVCCSGLSARAQEVTATINGTVTDPAGRVVVNAEVKAKDLDRGTVWPAHTNSAGAYTLTRLPVGRYEVRVTAPGFRTAVQTPIELQLNQVAVVNMQLVVGQASETVEVTSEAPLLQTETTEVSTVIDARTNVDLPLASRNYMQLTLLAPGSVTPNPSGFANGQTTGQNERPDINGNRFTANDYVLDGMDNNQMTDNFVAYAPQPDAIQEFNLISQNAPADFGNYMGGVISATIKGGTNSLHGSVFEFFRNNVLNANQWQNKLRAPFSPRQAMRWNQFGAAVGGPILRNKLFFFADYEGERYDFPSTTNQFSVLTAKERTGDFSELLAAGIVIKNPVTGTPFVGNVIPNGMLSQAALKIAGSSYYPTPINGGLSLNANDITNSQVNVNQGDGRLDWAINDKNHAFARYSESQTVNPVNHSYTLAYNTHSAASVWNTVGGYTRAFTTNLVNDARLGVNYVRVNSGASGNNISNPGTTFGIPALPSSILPAMQFSANTNVTGAEGSTVAFGNKSSLTADASTVIQYQNVLNYTHGKHSLRIGFQGWRLRMDGDFSGNNGLAGYFNFNGQYSGRAESDFMLGLPNTVGAGSPSSSWGQRGNIFGAFIQDDWKVSHNLVFNLGLRYEDHTPWYEAHDKQVNWNPTTGLLELPGQNGNPRALYNAYNGIDNYQPRIGMAYTPREKTTFRLAYGLSSFMEGTGQGLRLPENPPSSALALANYSALPYPTTSLDQGFAPLTPTTACTLAGLEQYTTACYTRAVLRAYDPNVRSAASSQWSFFIQHELTNTMTFQIGYVGQQTRHLDQPKDISQKVLESDGTIAPAPFFLQNQTVAAEVTEILATYTGATQNYNALQFELQGRLNHGLSYQASYTWAHCLTDGTGFFGEPSGTQSASQNAWYQNVYNTRADYGSCYYNVKGNFTGYMIYDLPFGRGRTYGANLNKLANAALGDWRLSVIPTFRGGFPLTLSANDASGTRSLGPRPDCNAPPQVLHKQPATGGLKGYQWFSPTPYSQAASGFGTCSIGSVYGPGEQNIDMGISKSFPVHAQQNLELRGEFLNTFNHPILNAPNTQLGPTLGVISNSQGARNIQLALKYNF